VTKKSWTTCDFLNGHLILIRSKISEKVSWSARFFLTYPLLSFNSEPPIGASVSHPATRRRATGSRILCLPNYLLSPHLCCRRPDGQTMVGGNIARGCLSECSTHNLRAAWLTAQLMKCHPSFAGVTWSPRVRQWRFLNGLLRSSEKWVSGHNLNESRKK
jgi:hypothetical protein